MQRVVVHGARPISLRRSRERSVRRRVAKLSRRIAAYRLKRDRARERRDRWGERAGHLDAAYRHAVHELEIALGHRSIRPS
jgi:hypothetical protein